MCGRSTREDAVDEAAEEEAEEDEDEEDEEDAGDAGDAEDCSECVFVSGCGEADCADPLTRSRSRSISRPSHEGADGDAVNNCDDDEDVDEPLAEGISIMVKGQIKIRKR